jgi:hypothetical protein
VRKHVASDNLKRGRRSTSMEWLSLKKHYISVGAWPILIHGPNFLMGMPEDSEDENEKAHICAERYAR